MSHPIRSVLSTAVLCLAALPASAQLSAGRDYIEISPALPTSDPDRIVVTEFFSYQCPHCYSFFPALHAWAQDLPDDVVFERVADSLGRSAWEPMVQTFYALQKIGKADALDLAIFRAIHVEGFRLFDKPAIAAWMDGQDVDSQEFSATYDSFGVNTSVRNAARLSRIHRIDSIPTLIIDGKYKVRIVDDGVFDSQLAVVAQLIAEVRAQRRL